MESTFEGITEPSASSQGKFKLIKNLTSNEKENFINSFDTVFCDCDGVIWQTLREGIPGSSEAIEYLRQRGKKVTFVTNNSISSTEDQLKKFERCNIKVEKQDLMHPAQNVCDHLKAIDFKGLIFCMATTPFKNLLRMAGFQLVEDDNRIISESFHDLRSTIYSSDPVKAIIIDVDFNLTAAKLMRAHVHLKDPECLLIGGAADMLIPFGGGNVLGSGPFIKIVEESTQRPATILGKPGKELRDMLQQRFCIKDPKRALFVGDSLTSDVTFGRMCGFQTLLVLTGGTQLSDLHADLPQSKVPDYVADKFSDLCK